MTSADNLCRQLGPRSGPTKCQADLSRYKLFDTDCNFLKQFLQNADFEKILLTSKKNNNKMQREQKVKMLNLTKKALIIHCLIQGSITIYQYELKIRSIHMFCVSRYSLSTALKTDLQEVLGKLAPKAINILLTNF